MIRKTLLTATLTLPLVAMSGLAYAGPQWNPTMPPWNSAQAQNQTGPSVTPKPYAQYVAPQLRYHSTGPKSPVKHPQRW